MAKKKKKKNKKTESSNGRFFPLPRKVKKILFITFCFIASVIAIFSFFDSAGPVGEYFKKTISFLFGSAFFAAPLVLFLAGLIVFKTRYKRFVLPLVGGSLLVLIGASGTFQVMASESARFDFINGLNGGFVGRIIGGPLVNLFDFWISFFVLASFFLSGTLILIQLLRVPSSLRKEKEESLAVKIFKNVIKREPKFNAKEINYDDEIKEIKCRIEAPNNFIDNRKNKEEAKEEKKENIVTANDENIDELSIKLPPADLLKAGKEAPSSGDIQLNMSVIEKTLENFDIPVEMSEVNVGPTVTQYTLKPSEGIKLSKITALSNDLSLSLAAHSVRIEAPIPGKSLVGVEIPNKKRAEVRLRELVESEEYNDSSFKLPLVMGIDVSGDTTCTRLEKMPHMLVAGSTGSGKTIYLNTLILSLIYRNSPQTMRLILVDPKRVEFSNYADLPHLLCPVIYDADTTSNALKWSVYEMERRMKTMSAAKTRDIASYNQYVEKYNKKNQDGEKLEVMPYIVIVVDELADLMMSKGKEIESKIVRLAQMARAAGIHLVLATQRPSVEVITGLIKANIISRIAFQVASQVDSRTILDVAGAEKLLGAGDMLFISGEISKPKRIQAPYVSEKEVVAVVDWVKNEYSDMMKQGDELGEDLEKGLEEITEESVTFTEGENDPLYEEARDLVVENKKASASFLQRRLRVGYARAARLIDMMEERGVVGPGDGAKPREIYMKKEDDDGEKWNQV